MPQEKHLTRKQRAAMAARESQGDKTKTLNDQESHRKHSSSPNGTGERLSSAYLDYEEQSLRTATSSLSTWLTRQRSPSAITGKEAVSLAFSVYRYLLCKTKPSSEFSEAFETAKTCKHPDCLTDIGLLSTFHRHANITWTLDDKEKQQMLNLASRFLERHSNFWEDHWIVETMMKIQLSHQSGNHCGYHQDDSCKSIRESPKLKEVMLRVTQVTAQTLKCLKDIEEVKSKSAREELWEEVSEMRAEYRDLTGTELPYMSEERVREVLVSGLHQDSEADRRGLKRLLFNLSHERPPDKVENILLCLLQT